MCVALPALNILCHALLSWAWSSFLGFVCWIYNLMHCFLDLLRSKMASWLSREGAGVAGLVHVWNPLVNRACLKSSHYTSFFKHHCAYYWSTTPAASRTAHYTSFFKHVSCNVHIRHTSTKVQSLEPIGQPCLPEELLCHSNCSHYTSFFKNLLCILDKVQKLC